MYFVEREKIEETLVFIEKEIAVFQKFNNLEDDFQKSALERVSQMLLEAVFDVGNMMIDGFIMRDPGSYDDIIDILLDENVINSDMESGFKKLIPFRKDLVQFYTDIKHDQLFAAFKENISVFEQFPERVRVYLTNELGPVSAFRH